MRFLLFFPAFFISIAIQAQYKVVIGIGPLPAYHQQVSDIYIAGSFNGWNPADKNYKLEHKGDGEYEIKLKLSQGAYEYKFTRGSWDKVETDKNGKGIGNRELIVTGDASYILNIEGWQDHFPTAPKISTAGRQVRILDTAFFIPQLNRYRRIWIYLPAGYSGNKRYPVLYLHDGQNVFDDSTSFSGEWGVDEFLDTTSLASMIVVAVDNGGQYRLNEYSPYDMDRYGKGEGQAYVDFLVKTLKPKIDKQFRTYRGKRHTYIAGSSMGGLISMYAVLKYPNVFGSAGIFSPAFWVAPKIFDLMDSRGKRVRSTLYFYAGKHEGETMVPDMLKAFEKMSKLTESKMISVIRDEGRHHESSWRKEFPLFYQWIIQ